MPKLKTLLPVIIALILVAGSIVFAAVPAGTPPECTDATNPGCNPPINVSSTLQFKAGILSLGDALRLAGGTTKGIDLNAAASGRSTPEGQINYGTANLNIYGGGSATAKDRKVTIFDQICDSLGTCRTVTDVLANTGGSSRYYTKKETRLNVLVNFSVSCDPGDIMVGGGMNVAGPISYGNGSYPSDDGSQSWNCKWSGSSVVNCYVRCLDASLPWH